MKKILVIDDEPCIRDVVKKYFSKMGYAAESETSIERLLGKLNPSDYWAYFCDLSMPGLSGIEIFHELKKLMGGSRVRFALLSGALPDSGISDLVEQHGIHFIRKPFSYEEFKRVLVSMEQQG